MIRGVVGVVSLIVASAAPGQEHFLSLDKSIRVEYHYAYTSDFEYDSAVFDGGTTTSHAVVFAGDFPINDRWRLFASIPYVLRKHNGVGLGVHNPATDFFQFDPPDRRFIDDGDYHGGLQDLSIGVQYRAIDRPGFSLSPFMSFGTPVTDYPYYGAAAIGRQLNEFHLGLSVELRPYFSDWMFQSDLTYAITEEVLGVNLNYWHAYVAAGYYLTPRFMPRVFVIAREAPNALIVEDIDAIGWDSEYGWRHDQILKHSFVNLGLGADFLVSERYSISGTYYQSVKSDNIYQLDAAFTIGLTYNF